MLRKKLFIELVIGIFIIFSFFAYQGYASRILTSHDSQIVKEGYKNVIYEDVIVSKIVEETTQENMFDIKFEVMANDDAFLDYSNHQVFVVLDTRSQHLEDLKADLLHFLQSYLGDYLQDSVKLYTLDIREHDLIYSASYYGSGAYILSIEPIENKCDMKDTIQSIQGYMKNFNIDEAHVVVFSDQDDANVSLLEENVYFYDYYRDTNIIETIIQTMNNKQWSIVDELSENVEFSHFITDDSMTSTCYYDEQQHAVVIEGIEIDANIPSYCVRLTNEDATFVSGKEYVLTKQSQLNYYTNEKKVVSFPVTSVKGYKADVELYNKSSISKVAVAQSSFELSHDINCQYCHLVKLPTFTATSDRQGHVLFKNVPSGHSYLLMQTATNENYELSKTSCNVSVLYGNVYYKGQSESYIFDNIPKHTNSLNLVLECKENNLLVDYEYDLHYKISGGGEVPLPKQKEVVADGQGNIIFEPIHFTNTGVYNYKISCINKGVKANDIIVVVNVTSELLSGNQDLKANITYYNQATKDNNIITIIP